MKFGRQGKRLNISAHTRTHTYAQTTHTHTVESRDATQATANSQNSNKHHTAADFVLASLRTRFILTEPTGATHRRRTSHLRHALRSGTADTAAPRLTPVLGPSPLRSSLRLGTGVRLKPTTPCLRRLCPHHDHHTSLACWMACWPQGAAHAPLTRPSVSRRS